MPARNRYHAQMRVALLKDGWTITHDPLRLVWGKRDLYVDPGAERLLAAEKAERKIAVEVQTFLGESPMKDLEQALGQFTLYREILSETHPDRTLYLAIIQDVFLDLFQEEIPQLLLTKGRLQLLVVNEQKEIIVQWIP